MFYIHYTAYPKAIKILSILDVLDITNWIEPKLAITKCLFWKNMYVEAEGFYNSCLYCASVGNRKKVAVEDRRIK